MNHQFPNFQKALAKAKLCRRSWLCCVATASATTKNQQRNDASQKAALGNFRVLCHWLAAFHSLAVVFEPKPAPHQTSGPKSGRELETAAKQNIPSSKIPCEFLGVRKHTMPDRSKRAASPAQGAGGKSVESLTRTLHIP